MGWERRGGRAYYYRRVRVGAKQVRRYIGGGPPAEVAAAADLALAGQRELTRANRRQERERWRAADEALLPLLRGAELLLRAALAAAGYRQHRRGPWRRRRITKGELAMQVDIDAQGPYTGEVLEAREVMRRASVGDRAVLPALAVLLDNHPEM